MILSISALVEILRLRNVLEENGEEVYEKCNIVDDIFIAIELFGSDKS